MKVPENNHDVYYNPNLIGVGILVAIAGLVIYSLIAFLWIVL
jgi:hypothetical protein